MLKIVGYWTEPNDIEGFEKHYREIHLPKAAALPGLRRLVVTRPVSGFEGGKPEHYRVAELVFDDAEALALCADTPEYRAMRDDAEDIHSKFGTAVTGELGEEVIVDLG
ncbi:unannotated protein [freshwater metagenome]|uniref:Unannotated protein n=1 Tax=freshwater metagenome TaxID=449393 RepID=A0A6J7KNX4_9ZZZZ|nr:EthD family reductase [Actinomycetota bacterium]